jgi:hypothetical protein
MGLKHRTLNLVVAGRSKHRLPDADRLLMTGCQLPGEAGGICALSCAYHFPRHFRSRGHLSCPVQSLSTLREYMPPGGSYLSV